MFRADLPNSGAQPPTTRNHRSGNIAGFQARLLWLPAKCAHSGFVISVDSPPLVYGIRETMTKIVKEFDVRAPPERVFEAISKPERYPQWADFVKAASSRGPKTHWVYEMEGMKVESDTEETACEENRVYGFRQTGGFLKHGETRLEIQPSKNGSSVVWTNQYELPYSYLGKLMDKLKARKQFEKAMEQAIKGLTALVER